MSGLVVVPDRSYYLPGQTVRLQVQIPGRSGGRVTASISSLTSEVATLTGELGRGGTALFEWSPPPTAPRGYGVDLNWSPGGSATEAGSTAFDVLHHWTERPRYGFVADFSAGRRGDATFDALLPFHINALQFYDWQYRHDELVAPQPHFVDPLGRRLSVETIRRFVDGARFRGIGAMAYAAIYAASLEFQRSHLGWALYDVKGTPLTFEGFLGYMDPTPGRPWSKHLIAQCELAMDELAFDGIHLDQYGEPRHAWDANGEEVDLAGAFSGVISALKDRRPRAVVVMNAVKNWPAKVLAGSRQDYFYVELWPDQPTYIDVARVVREARRNSHGKPVVVAVYIPSDQIPNVLMATAVVFANGGTRIVLGEEARLLADPYFPRSQAIPDELKQRLRRYWDTAVRYGDLLFTYEPTDGQQLAVEPIPRVSTVVHRGPGLLGVSLLNQWLGHDDRWDEPHGTPPPQEDLEVRFSTQLKVISVLWVNPDRSDPRACEVDWKPTEEGGIVRLPELNYWGVLLLEVEQPR